MAATAAYVAYANAALRPAAHGWHHVVMSRARGAMLGAAVGDAAGAVLEFSPGGGGFSGGDVERALTFPGGGFRSPLVTLAPGQVTDDTELAIALAHGLVAGNGVLDLDGLLRQYRLWLSSGPVDVGNALHAVLSANAFASKAMAASDMLSFNGRRNEANGSLMRAAPLGVWAHKLGSQSAFYVGFDDALLTHAAVAPATGAYVCAIAYLVAHPGDQDRAADAIAAARRCILQCAEEVADHNCVNATAWLDEATGAAPLAFGPHIGHARIGFTHAFRHLHLRSTYSGAIRQTLRGGGDTDTNAAIVGGLIGAYWGVDDIPLAWRSAVLACAPRASGENYSASRLDGLTGALMAVAPSALVTEGDEYARYRARILRRARALLNSPIGESQRGDGE